MNEMVSKQVSKNHLQSLKCFFTFPSVFADALTRDVITPLAVSRVTFTRVRAADTKPSLIMFILSPQYKSYQDTIIINLILTLTLR